MPDFTSPAALQHLVTSYQISQAVYVATRLGVADILAGGPKTAEELAPATGTHAPSLARLLRALVAFDILDETEPGQFALTPMGACLRANAPDSLRDAVLMWGSDYFWQVAADLLHSVQTGESAVRHLFGTATPFDYYHAHPEVGAILNAGWTAQARSLAYDLIATYDFSNSGTIVDVGGNRGLILATILQAYAGLHGILFDLPHVVQEAVPVLEQAGVADRCTLRGGDMFAEIPTNGDTYLVSRIIHDWDDAKAIAILRSCRRAMRPQTALLLVERVVPTNLNHTPAVQDAMTTDLTMLIHTGGRERTDVEYAALLTAADFVLERIIPSQGGYSVLKSALGTSRPE